MSRTAILVLGMHRSGTSALTGMLARLGVTMPRTLMPADDHNSLGYWESSAFCDFHDRLLASAGTSWDSWSRVDMSAIDAATLERYGHEFDALLSQEFAGAELFAIKDPRVCRLVPFWQQSLARAGVTSVPLLVWRDPSEVANSLAARDRIVTEHALLLWLRHVLDAERATRGRPRLLVRYEDLLTDWRGLARHATGTLGLVWPRCLESVSPEIDSFLQSSLRHHATVSSRLVASPQLTQWIQDTLGAYAALACGDDLAATASLDAITTEFERVAGDFAAAFTGDRHRQRLRAQSQIDAIRRHAGNLERELAAARGELSAARQALETEQVRLRERLEREQAQNRELEQAAWRLRENLAATEWQVSELTNARVFLQTQCEQLSSEVAALRAHVGELSAAQATLRTAVDEQSLRGQLAENEVRALRHSLSWRLTAPLRRLRDLVAPQRR